MLVFLLLLLFQATEARSVHPYTCPPSRLRPQHYIKFSSSCSAQCCYEKDPKTNQPAQKWGGTLMSSLWLSSRDDVPFPEDCYRAGRRCRHINELISAAAADSTSAQEPFPLVRLELILKSLITDILSAVMRNIKYCLLKGVLENCVKQSEKPFYLPVAGPRESEVRGQSFQFAADSVGYTENWNNSLMASVLMSVLMSVLASVLTSVLTSVRTSVRTDVRTWTLSSPQPGFSRISHFW